MTTPTRTQYRFNKLSTLLAELSQRDLTTAQTSELLDCKRVTAIKRLSELRAAGLIKDGVCTDRRVPLFHLVGSPEQIANFIADISVSRPRRRAVSRATAPSHTLVARCLADPSRHLHIAHDDEPFVPRLHRFKPFRDGLVAALFGAPVAREARP
jgi:hypothetical protein